MKADKNLYLTTVQAAELLQVSARTVARWVESGALPAFRLGRVVRIDADILRGFIMDRCHTDAKTAPIGGSVIQTQPPASRLDALLETPTRQQKPKSSGGARKRTRTNGERKRTADLIPFSRSTS